MDKKPELPEINKKLFINNKWVDAVGGETMTVENPSNGEVIATVARAMPADVDLAVEAATKAFNSDWSKTKNMYNRRNLLNKIADILERDAKKISVVESFENGKALWESGFGASRAA